MLNKIFDADTEGKRGKVRSHLKSKIKAPFTYVAISTLGGLSRASAMITVSLDNKKAWPNGILRNSRYFMLSLDRNGVLEQFTVSYKIPKKMRKARAKTLADAVLKINKYIRDIRR